MVQGLSSDSVGRNISWARFTNSVTLPGPVTTAIRDHHSAPGGGPDEVLVNIVRLANHLVAPGGSETQLTRSELRRLRRQIGVDADAFDLVRGRVEEWSYCLQTSGVLTEFA